MLEEGDIDGALQKLKSLPNTHPQSLKAREKMVSHLLKWNDVFINNLIYLYLRPTFIYTAFKMKLSTFSATVILLNNNPIFEILLCLVTLIWLFIR